jgi:hypothetical protein
MRRRVVGLPALLLAVVLLGGCSEAEAYCNQLVDDAVRMGAVDPLIGAMDLKDECMWEWEQEHG